MEQEKQKMKRIVSAVLALIIALSLLSAVTLAVGEENNIIPEKDSTFETGTTAWQAFAGGSVAAKPNPNGEGNVLEYTVDKTKTWASPALDIKPLIQKAGEAGTYYLYMELYAEENVSTSVTIRTNDTSFSMSDAAKNNYPRLGQASVSAGEWLTYEAEINIEEDDLNLKEGYWFLCFDGLSRFCDKFYVDNVYLSTEPLEIERPEDGVEVPAKTAITRSDKTLIGTIRWDAFTKSTPDGTDPASQVARVLSPAKYHNQAPFFASVESDGTVSFPEYTVELWEKEAEYAVNGGLDYFAYLWYETTDAMSQPRKLHLESSKKDTIKMCGILESVRSNKTMNELFEAMKDSCYLRLDGRPVLYLYGVDDWTAENVEKVRKQAVLAGIRESLYVVGMTTDKTMFTANLKKDIDAVSWYSTGADKKDMTYAELAKSCEDVLNTMGILVKSGKIDVIPSFTTGRDSRARIETGVSWVKGDPKATEDSQKPYGNRYSLQPTMDELKTHVTKFLDFMLANKEVTTSNLVCSYGWNEHEEGGWLCPTLECDENGNPVKDANGNNKANTERLDALREVVDAYRAKEASGETPAPDVTDVPGVAETPVKTDNKGRFNALWVIVPAAVVVCGGAAAFVIVKKKKKSK